MDIPLQDSITAYYTNYYRDVCSIPNYTAYVSIRNNEEELERNRLRDLEIKLGKLFNPGQKHFILGAGTGGLAIVLNKDYGCSVSGIEPDKAAFSIIEQKCQSFGVESCDFRCEAGERISFPGNSFDFIHAMSVLEHVEDVKMTLSELLRILKPGGKIYINCPNYSFPFEGHYKIPFPVFLPRVLGALYLKIRGKSSNFLWTINFLSIRRLQKLLFQFPNIDFQYLYRGKSRRGGRLSFLFKFYQNVLGIYPLQEVLITKNS